MSELPEVRLAHLDDAAAIAALHADSWRRHYRGAYSDSFLDGDVVDDRLEVWTARLSTPSPGSATLVMSELGALVGFAHLFLDEDSRWGSLVENLHVVSERHRRGLGRRLMVAAAATVRERSTHPGLYLWVLEQNVRAQRFYEALGGVCVERAPCPRPGGVADRLEGTPTRLRMAWTDAAALE